MQSISATSIRCPSARAPTLNQRGLDRGIAEDAAKDIGDEDRARRRTFLVAGIAHQRGIETALGMHDHGVGRAPAAGPDCP